MIAALAVVSTLAFLAVGIAGWMGWDHRVAVARMAADKRESMEGLQRAHREQLTRVTDMLHANDEAWNAERARMLDRIQAPDAVRLRLWPELLPQDKTDEEAPEPEFDAELAILSAIQGRGD